MYVLTRTDLNPTYRAVQGSHALAAYSLEHPDQFKAWNNGTVVFLGLHYQELKKFCLNLKESGRIISVWNEPDLDDQVTAMACIDDGFVFRNLKTA